MRALAFVAALVVGCTTTPPTPTLTPDPVQAPTATSGLNDTPRPQPRALFGDGTHLVPQDVAPGTYRTIGYTEQCYWVRLSGFEGGLEDWVSSAIGPGYHVVTIGPDDAGFDSRECEGWTRDLAAVTDSPTAFGEGTYIVGTDLEPGTWVAESGDNCYWARLSGFGGTEQEVIESGLTSDVIPPMVTIPAGDAGFTSNGCGTWSRTAP